MSSRSMCWLIVLEMAMEGICRHIRDGRPWRRLSASEAVSTHCIIPMLVSSLFSSLIQLLEDENLSKSEILKRLNFAQAIQLFWRNPIPSNHYINLERNKSQEKLI